MFAKAPSYVNKHALPHLEVVEEAPLPAVHVPAHEAHEGLDLVGGDVFVEQLLVVVQQRSDGVLRQDVVPGGNCPQVPRITLGLILLT